MAFTSGHPARRVCIFAHFDRDDIVDDYVFFYLSSLLKNCQKLVFSTTSNLSGHDLERLQKLGILVVARDNIGYDFASYKAGLERLSLEKWDELIICNDSVYGPIFDLADALKRMSELGGDFVGMTESHEIAFHLQSYFLLFKSNCFMSEAFADFWNNLGFLETQAEIIENYEVGLSQVLLEAGFQPQSLSSLSGESSVYARLRSSREYLKMFLRRFFDLDLWAKIYSVLFRGRKLAVNPTHFEWRSLIEIHRIPFIKVKLMRDNPKSLERPEEIIRKIALVSDYPVQLIERHLSRMKNSRP